MIQRNINSIFLFLGFLFIGSQHLAGSAPEVRGTHWSWVHGRYEAIVGSQVIEFDPLRCRWSPHREGWPALTQVQQFHSYNLWWDGFEVVGTPYREHGEQDSVLAFFPFRGREPGWFPRSPVRLEKGERIMAACQGKALLRRDAYPDGGQFTSTHALKVAGEGYTILEMVDLDSGRRTELAKIPGLPFSLQVNAAAWNGELFFFTNRGDAWRWGPHSASPITITEDFYQAAGIEVVKRQFLDPAASLWPEFKAYPCFDANGRIILAMEGYLNDESIDGATLREKFRKALKMMLEDPGITESGRRFAKRFSEYPIETGKRYQFPVRSAILLAFDPETKKWEQFPEDKTSDLLGPNHDTLIEPIRKTRTFKDPDNTLPLVVKADGTLVFFDYDKFKAARPEKETGKAADKPAKKRPDPAPAVPRSPERQ